MADVVTPEKRSVMMAGIKGKDTKPEIRLRKALFARGYRYRLHDKSLPGSPDMVFPRFKAAVFVNGCFWHVHDCHMFKWPSSRIDFWKEKLNGNRARDQANVLTLHDLGWRTLTIWECALKGKTRLPFDDIIDQTTLWLKSNELSHSIGGANGNC